ncbi:MAG TPA: hypothetical protein PKG77_25190 [Phycisphaerae bacterium]|nr:hypothetical protein [Phycisphaerae bacterium]
MAKDDRYYASLHPSGQYWCVYDRRTPCETNRSGHACVCMITIRYGDAQERAENIAARHNGQMAPHADLPALEVTA